MTRSKKYLDIWTLALNCSFFLSTLDVWLLFFILVPTWLCLWIVHCSLSLLFSLTCITKNATEGMMLEQKYWDSHEFTILSGNDLYFTCESIFWSILCRNNKRGQIYVSELRCSRYVTALGCSYILYNQDDFFLSIASHV